MTKLSVKKPFTVLVAVVLVFVLGIVSFTRLKTDLLPKMDLPYVIVMTTAPGASPERVETTVTQPLESALATTSGLENMQSISMENASIIIMEFGQTINMDSAMIEMSTSIDMVEGYFEDTVSTPMLMKLNPDMLPVQVLSVDMDGMDIKELSSYIENDFTPYLERIDGVATVDVTGLVQDYISIELNQEKIDTINDSILKAVDAELIKAKNDLDKAKSVLAKGKQELADGKKELADGKEDAFKQLAEGAAKLDAGQAQLLDINSQKTMLEARKALLEGARPAVEALSLVRTSIGVLDAVALDGVEDSMTINQAIKHLEDKNANPLVSSFEKAARQIEIDALKALITDSEQMEAQFSGTDKISKVKKSLKNTQTQLEDTLRSIGISETIISTGNIAAIDSEIASVESELKLVEVMLSQVQMDVKQLEESYAALEIAKMQAVSAMAVGEAQIATAEAELEKAGCVLQLRI